MTIDKHVSQFYNNDWFIYDGQEISGPVNFSNILEWFYSNDETKNMPYYVCQEGMSSWQSLKDTIDLHNKLQQFSVEEEKNKFIEQIESQLKKINKDIKDSISSSGLYSTVNATDKSENNLNLNEDKNLNQNQTLDKAYTLSTTQTATNNSDDNNHDDSNIDSFTESQYTASQRLQQDQYQIENKEELIEEEEEYIEEIRDNDTRYKETLPEQKTHQILKNQTKNKTYKRSLKVPPLSKDMELIILTNRLRLGKKRSLVLSSIVFPILTCGLYFIYWLIAVQLELTKHLNKKTSNILLLCSLLPVLNIFSIYHLLSLNKQLNRDYTTKNSRLVSFIQSTFLSLVLPIFTYSFQKALNIYWKNLLQQKI